MGQLGRKHSWVIWSNLPAEAGPSLSKGTGLSPDGSGMPPVRETPHPLWTINSSALPSSQGKSSSSHPAETSWASAPTHCLLCYCLAPAGRTQLHPLARSQYLLHINTGFYPLYIFTYTFHPVIHMAVSEPKIDNSTQEPMNCTNHTAYVQCLPAPNITCRDHLGIEKVFTGQEVGFYKPIECRNVNGYSYKVAVALSLFLGWLGADRFYLGYPALGLLKFCTVGFCGIGSLIDFILISMQIVGPSDGSSYIIDYYGARLTRLSITNATFRKMQTYP
uniref:TM2 domain containing 1 n=2 Tax=Passeriformes TaxID=9126 RepID=A0A8D2QEB4_ZONAL